MIIYYSVFAFSIVLIGVASFINTSARMDVGKEWEYRYLSRVACVIAGGLIALLIGLRAYDVGTDTSQYVRNYNSIIEGSDVYRVEAPLYYLINYVVGALSNGSYTALFLLEGMLFSFFLLRGILRSSPMPWLSLLIFCCFGFTLEAVNQYRQILACVILLNSFEAYERNQTKVFVAWVLLAAGFHISSLLFLLILPARSLHLSAGKCLLYGSLFLVIGAALSILRPLLAQIPFYGSYIGSSIDSAASLTSMLNVGFRWALFLYLLKERPRIESAFPGSSSLYPIIFVGVLFQELVLFSSVFGRIPTYFISFLVLLIPCYVECQSRSRSLKLFLVLICFIALFTFDQLLSDYSDYTYTFYFDKVVNILPK